jgi:hypothetical protein
MNCCFERDPYELTRETRAGNGVVDLLDTRLRTWLTPPMSPAGFASISNRSRHHSSSMSSDSSNVLVRKGRQG